jgi:enamine deaminase RidA (YjgF/YER057c/UK114 family)
LYLSGQGAYGADHKLVGADDYYAQTKQAFVNVISALTSEGATFDDVVKATYYVVKITPAALGDFARAMNEVDRSGVWPAGTLIGVDSLTFDEMLVEIDVTAVLG